MYSGVANSPETYLKENVAPEGTTIYVNDASVLGDLPTLAVIGTDQNAETVLVKSKRTDGGLEVQRAIEGLAKKWEKATVIARNFTNLDYKTLKENIELLNDDKVSKVQGKGLSTNDFTTAEQTKLKGIEAGANKTIIVNDLTTGGTTKALSAEQGKILFQNVDNGKLQIANAIIDKGQTGVSNKSSFQELATGIRNIKTGYGIGDIIKPADVKVLSYTEEKAPNKIWEFTGNTNSVNSVAVDSQGNVYSGSYKKVMKISPNGTKIWEFTGHTNTIRSVAVDSNGYVYSGSDDKKLMKISPSGQKIWEFTGHTNTIRSVAVDSNGYVYSGSDDKKLMK
ncbi:WD40 repeat domain-containing protein, partial [Peptoniphilus sp. BV3C26]|uniref:WD40 repeat domain-containing protein n=1 Tax=Peptoniphilus sp. BV3C26 TaxID=1111134 RepID=UPI0012DC6763